MSKVKTKEELGNEIRFLKAKIEREQVKCAELEEQIRGYQELIGINNALVASVLNVVGEICVPRYAVTEAMETLDVAVQLDLERDAYYMQAVKKETKE